MMHSEEKVPEHILVAEVRKGRVRAFDKLFDKYSQRLYSFAMSLLKTHEDAEEVVQEVFLRIWQKRKELVETTSFKSFLFTIAKNIIVDHFRKKIKEKNYREFLLERYDYDNSSPDMNIEYKELYKILVKTIEKLPERRKQIYKLSRNEGLSHKEIASRLGISINTVENQINLALKIIKKRFGKQIFPVLLFFFLFV